VYAGRGWPVFPCHTPGPRGCSCGRACGSPGKHPRVTGGLHAATVDEAVIRGWWGRWPAANVAVRTGAVSGLVVIDIDAGHGGEATLATLAARYGPLPEGRVVRTGAGRHHYLAHPGGTVRNDVGRRLGPGVDVRADGGYVLAPPSRHASGAVYEVAGCPTDLPALPTWLDRLLQPPAPQAGPPAPVRHATGWARAALDGELEALLGAAEGARNHTLNRAAFRLGQLVEAGHLDELAVTDRLVAAALALGLGEREAQATARSGLRAGRQHPRGPAPRSAPGSGLGR
jgi:hypothetical protein